jgi:tRNA threonylcarbamoyladenosine biosynthesis protein TsaB
MNLLAVDTATEQCSVAIVTDGMVWSRVVPTARSHADMILPMIDELLAESALTLAQIDGMAFGRGPGSFTGVRIAVSVIQGLALARQLRVAGVSNLAAVAQQAATTQGLPTDAEILVCMDARMQEVYWAQYRVSANGLVTLIGREQVSTPSAVAGLPSLAFGAGTGWRAYPELRGRYPVLPINDGMLPRALEVARLGIAEFQAGRATTAADAQPVYLRDQVVSRSAGMK